MADDVGVLAGDVGVLAETEGILAICPQVEGADITDTSGGNWSDIAVLMIPKRDHEVHRRADGTGARLLPKFPTTLARAAAGKGERQEPS